MCVCASDYLIVGGLAFVPLSQQVDPPAYMGSNGSTEVGRLTCSDEQIVILQQIIAHEVRTDGGREASPAS